MGDFAVVIVNYRSADLARRCAAAAAADGPAELLVVDNASGDGSVEALRAAGLDVLARSVNAGFAAGVNAGFAATRSPVVVLLNPDTQPRPGALRALVDHLARTPRAGIAAPRLRNADGTPQPNAYRYAPGRVTLLAELCVPAGLVLERLPALDRYRVPAAAWRPGARVAHVTGAALAVRRAAYAAAGPLDEGFFLYLEETEWQERVRRAGFTIELVTDAEVTHLIRGGGEAALAPSPHFLASTRRYLALRGYSCRSTDRALAATLAVSRLAARAWDRWPGTAPGAGAHARAWERLR